MKKQLTWLIKTAKSNSLLKLRTLSNLTWLVKCKQKIQILKWNRRIFKGNDFNFFLSDGNEMQLPKFKFPKELVRYILTKQCFRIHRETESNCVFGCNLQILSTKRWRRTCKCTNSSSLWERERERERERETVEKNLKNGSVWWWRRRTYICGLNVEQVAQHRTVENRGWSLESKMTPTLIF